MFRGLLAASLLIPASFACAQGWEQVSSWGIQGADNKWIAGRTTDVVEVAPNQVLVSTDGSGVWWLQRNLGVSLSRTWDSTDMTSVAKNPVGGYFAAGVQGGTNNLGVLYQTKPFDRVPLLAPWEKVALPGGLGVINRILTLDSPPRIVLATETGLYWSNIPTLLGGISTRPKFGGPQQAPGFDWKRAEGSSIGAFFDVQKTEGGIVASMRIFRRGPGSPVRLGTWQTNTTGRRLVLTDTTMIGTDPTMVSSTTVAVSQSNPQVMYAMCGDYAGAMLSINRSDDGGRTWRMRRGWIGTDGSTTFRTDTEMGRYGDFRSNTVAVSPSDPNTLLVGWTHAFMSRDGGDTFVKTGYTHDDHARFAYFGNRLYDCNDGGVMVSTDDGQTFNHDFNRKLANLQFYPQSLDVYGLGSNGMGGGLQDNNVVGVYWGAGAPGPWQFPEPPNADGGCTIFLPGGVAYCDNGGIYKWAVRHETGFGDVTTMEHPNAPASLVNAEGNISIYPRVYKVFRPSRTNRAGEPIVAIGFKEETPANANHACQVYGLTRTGALPPRWEPLVRFTVPANDGVSAIASYNGDQLYVGFAKSAQISRVNVDNGATTVQTGLPNDDGYIISEIVAPGPHDVYAIRNQYVATSGHGAVYMLSKGSAWSRVSGLPDVLMGSLAAASPQLVFVGTEGAVYKMENNRSLWTDVSTGLPKFIHPTAMQIAVGVDSKRYLYLATYGWSVWRMPM